MVGQERVKPTLGYERENESRVIAQTMNVYCEGVCNSELGNLPRVGDLTRPRTRNGSRTELALLCGDEERDQVKLVQVMSASNQLE
jgi:hypothetical protein